MIYELNIWSLEINKKYNRIIKFLFHKGVADLEVMDIGEKAKSNLNNPNFEVWPKSDMNTGRDRI